MKKKNFIVNGLLAVSASMFVMALVVAFHTLMSFDAYSRMHYDKVMAYSAEKDVIQTKAFVKDVDEPSGTLKQVVELGREITILELERASMKKSLEKARSERNKSYGMVAGLSYQPSQSLGEVIVLEKKINKVDHRLAALNSQSRSLRNMLAMNK